jgi:hypothetical protein
MDFFVICGVIFIIEKSSCTINSLVKTIKKQYNKISSYIITAGIFWEVVKWIRFFPKNR